MQPTRRPPYDRGNVSGARAKLPDPEPANQAKRNLTMSHAREDRKDLLVGAVHTKTPSKQRRKTSVLHRF
ncbi:MAG: hypothetical protein HY675_25045 [Chloroflexi bacterium]|nr:hypothetical protein [Chloroflexota bacterium]